MYEIYDSSTKIEKIQYLFQVYVIKFQTFLYIVDS